MKNPQFYLQQQSAVNGTKKIFIFLFFGLSLIGFPIQLNAINYSGNRLTGNSNNINGNSFIFMENGVEFSVFKDGQFDFNIISNNLNISLNSSNTNISFNTGHNYNSYVQYDEYGAIVQIQNTPIYYDDYGRVIQAGNVNVYYNNVGYVSRVGNLYVNYNPYNRFTYCTGYINVYNRAYVYRPWHRAYCAPSYQYAVVYNRPYRMHYYPTRYNYCKPFYNNYRPTTSIGGRRGTHVYRNSSHATVNRSNRNITTVNKNAHSRRSVSQIKNRQGYDIKGHSQGKRENAKLRKTNSTKVNNKINRRLSGTTNTALSSKPSSFNRPNNNDFNRNKRAFSNKAETRNALKSSQSTSMYNRNISRSKSVNHTQKIGLTKKPNTSRSRIYNTDNNKIRSTQISKQTVNKPRTTQKSTVSRSIQNSKSVSQNRSNSKNNTKSTLRRRL